MEFRVELQVIETLFFFSKSIYCTSFISSIMYKGANVLLVLFDFLLQIMVSCHYFIIHRLGFSISPLFMKVSFGEKKLATDWNNSVPSPLITRLQEDIKRFGSILKLIYKYEFIFIFIPIQLLLTTCNFSKDFQNHIVKIHMISTL